MKNKTFLISALVVAVFAIIAVSGKVADKKAEAQIGTRQTDGVNNQIVGSQRATTGMEKIMGTALKNLKLLPFEDNNIPEETVNRLNNASLNGLMREAGFVPALGNEFSTGQIVIFFEMVGLAHDNNILRKLHEISNPGDPQPKCAWYQSVAYNWNGSGSNVCVALESWF